MGFDKEEVHKSKDSDRSNDTSGNDSCFKDQSSTSVLEPNIVFYQQNLEAVKDETLSKFLDELNYSDENFNNKIFPTTSIQKLDSSISQDEKNR